VRFKHVIARILPGFVGACFSMLAIFIATMLIQYRHIDYRYLHYATLRIFTISIFVGLIGIFAKRVGVLGLFVLGMIIGPILAWGIIALTL
jgi:hypothetical protein